MRRVTGLGSAFLYGFAEPLELVIELGDAVSEP
jgi:hypothetical protein